MKKLIALAFGLALGGSVFAQGTVTFSNDGSTLVRTNDGVNSGVLVVNGGKVELMYGASGTNLVWNSLGINNITPIAGRFSGGTKTTGSDIPGGSGVWLMVRGWTGNFATYADALAGGAMVGQTSWRQPTGDPANAVPPVAIVAPVSPVTGYPAPWFGGLNLVPVPEPSSLALAGLGLASLLIFRRK